MIGSKRSPGTEDDSAAVAPQPRGSIDEIARRLDHLLRTMAEVPSLEPPATVRDGALKAARRAWKARRERERIFGPGLVANPAWDILLDLFLAHAEDREVTVFGVCASTTVDEWTVVRWIANLVEAKLVTRQSTAADPRSIKLTLTDQGLAMMCDYFNRVADLDAAGE